MPSEILAIVDTSVKIGLGALISGVSTYFISNKNNAHQISKEITIRNLSSIEKAAEEINEYFTCFKGFLSSLDGIRTQHPDSMILPDPSMTFIKKRDNDFVSSIVPMNAGISKLLLLNILKPIDILTEIRDIETELRIHVMFEHKLPSKVEITEYKNKVTDAKASFYAALSEHITS